MDGGGGEGCIEDNPLFVVPGYWDWPNEGDWVEGDYHLLGVSPCIDAGDPSLGPAPGQRDIDGQLRVWDGDYDGTAIVDMGADEFGSRPFGNTDSGGELGPEDVRPIPP